VLIDTHCHLDATEFDVDRAAVIARTTAAGVAAVVIPAVERAAFSRVRALAASFEGGAYALGIHPLCVEQAVEDDLEALHTAIVDALADPRFVGVGEIGLDHFVPGLDRAKQRRFFEAQLRLARRFDLPVILHVRRAQDPILGLLRRFTVRGGIAHAFNGSAQQAQAYAELGFALGIGGVMTDARALRIRALASTQGLENLVLETDAPDLAPIWCRGERNEPAQLPPIAASLASLRGCTVSEVVRGTGTTALRVLPRLAGMLQPSIPCGES